MALGRGAKAFGALYGFPPNRRRGPHKQSYGVWALRLAGAVRTLRFALKVWALRFGRPFWVVNCAAQTVKNVRWECGRRPGGLAALQFDGGHNYIGP